MIRRSRKHVNVKEKGIIKNRASDRHVRVYIYIYIERERVRLSIKRRERLFQIKFVIAPCKNDGQL